MQKRGYIGDFEIVDDHKGKKAVIDLLGRLNKCGAISPNYDTAYKDLEGVTKQLLPSRQFGYVIFSTSVGLIDHEAALRLHTGGKLIGFFY